MFLSFEGNEVPWLSMHWVFRRGENPLIMQRLHYSQKFQPKSTLSQWINTEGKVIFDFHICLFSVLHTWRTKEGRVKIRRAKGKDNSLRALLNYLRVDS